ncbi:ABC transporter substrate-binding protein [Antribacter sp. KLBMP9083]|uniref:ABC transporter substrate-binding protein n=1 Tax=Antribacter soli TaxID=2910976 RepID=A0AA41QHL0_9MICO|nr:ABC transporter substrate-binding protein [Antribacter soli]MCF4123604.1 ABC transporter substrate-binding protein [Antribacter soli]
MRRRMSMTVAAAMAAMTFVLAGCASSYQAPTAPLAPGETAAAAEADEGRENLTPITVGVLPIVDVAPLYLGVEKGIFEDHGIDLTIDVAANGGDIINNVLSRRWQFGFSNVLSIVSAGTSTGNIKVVAAGNYSSGDPAKDFGAIVVPATSSIQDVGDLAGKKVAVNAKQGLLEATVRRVVDAGGGNSGTLSFEPMGFGAMPDALTAGTVDAAFIVEPLLSVAKAQGARELPNSSFGTVDPNLMIAAYFASNDLTVTDPEIVEQFADAMNESLGMASRDPEAARAVLDSYTKIDAEVKAAMTLPKWSPVISKDSAVLLSGLAGTYFQMKINPDLSFPS